MIRPENQPVTPGHLEERRQVEQGLKRIGRLRIKNVVRRLIREFNAKIRKANTTTNMPLWMKRCWSKAGL